MSNAVLKVVLCISFLSGCLQLQAGQQERAAKKKPSADKVAPSNPAPDSPVTGATKGTKEPVPRAPETGAIDALDGKPQERPTAKQIADWVREAYTSRHDLAYDFTVTQAQDNDMTWTFKGTARYSGRKSRVEMTEVEGPERGRKMRFTCDVEGDRTIFTEDIGGFIKEIPGGGTEDVEGQCRTFTQPLADFSKKNWRPPVYVTCMIANHLKSWVGGSTQRINMTHERITASRLTGEKTITDADSKSHVCYVLMDGIPGSYAQYFVDKSTHLVCRWWVDRTDITRDTHMTYHSPQPVSPKTFRLECPE